MERLKKESFNHYTYGTVDDWMFRTIGGVDQEDTGYRRLMIHPQPDKSLTWAKRSFETENGTVSVSWKREGGQFLLTADIPCNTHRQNHSAGWHTAYGRQRSLYIELLRLHRTVTTVQPAMIQQLNAALNKIKKEG